MSTRAAILHAAEEIICKDRNSQYGEPEDVFTNIAGMWENYLEGRGALDKNCPGLFAHDVAAMMVLFKVARFAANPSHHDSSVDCVGYAAIMGELASRGTEEVKGVKEVKPTPQAPYFSGKSTWKAAP